MIRITSRGQVIVVKSEAELLAFLRWLQEVTR